MANILVLGVKIPCVGGGQEALVRSLISELKKIGHRVDESGEIPLRKCHEGVLRRECLGSAKHGVLDDVRDAGGILRRSTEGDEEDLVAVRVGHDLNAGTALYVV